MGNEMYNEKDPKSFYLFYSINCLIVHIFSGFRFDVLFY